MSTKTLSALLLVAALFGCTKKDATESSPPAPAAPSGTSATTAEATAEVPPNPVDEDDPGIVVADDLKEKATQQISETNLESQLDDLEKEIGKSE
jgi:TolA-binding protein